MEGSVIIPLTGSRPFLYVCEVEVFAKVLTTPAGLGIITPSCEDLMTDMAVDNMVTPAVVMIGPPEVLMIIIVTAIVMIIILRGRGRGK